jgi:hypothetical protein
MPSRGTPSESGSPLGVRVAQSIRSPYDRALFELAGLEQHIQKHSLTRTAFLSHRYLFASGDPVDRVDPLGLTDELEEEGFLTSIRSFLRRLFTFGSRTVLKEISCIENLEADIEECELESFEFPDRYGACIYAAGIKCMICEARN